MNVLGISAFYHDSAAALVRDGEVVAAAQEERFSRRKGDADLPLQSVAFCLDAAELTVEDLDYVGFYDKPILTFSRLLETYLSFAPSGLRFFAKSIPLWVKEKILQKDLVLKGLEGMGRGTLPRDRLVFGLHHHSHAASAFFPSPFEEAAVVVLDGVGEWATTSIGSGSGQTIELRREIRFPHSLGLLYSAFTYHLGFEVNEGEYKVMGLAPYGEPTYAQTIREHLIDLRDDGSFALDMRYFDYCTGLKMTSARFDRLFDGPPRRPGDPLLPRHMDMARSVQSVLEDAVLGVCRAAHRETGLANLSLAGGVALNCVANGRLLREGPFDRVWIQPAAGDAGAALGVALSIAHEVGGVPRRTVGGADGMNGTYLGPAYDEREALAELTPYAPVHHRHTDEELPAVVARALAGGLIVGWFQGRMEFGPRALGNRSILADPRAPGMQRDLNLKIKYRESFRPFAPVVARENASRYFDLEGDSPYMLLVAPVTGSLRCEPHADEKARRGLDQLSVPRSRLPAVTHVDGSARVQTLGREENPRLHALLAEFEALTGCGVLVNTSFNVRDEPIVCSPGDAYRCFMATEMDVLVIGNLVLFKEEQ